MTVSGKHADCGRVYQCELHPGSLLYITGQRQRHPKDFLTRHIAYLNIVRMQLRKTIPWATNEDYHRQVVSEADEVKQFDHAIVELFQSLDKMDV